MYQDQQHRRRRRTSIGKPLDFKFGRSRDSKTIMYMCNDGNYESRRKEGITEDASSRFEICIKIV